MDSPELGCGLWWERGDEHQVTLLAVSPMSPGQADVEREWCLWSGIQGAWHLWPETSQGSHCPPHPGPRVSGLGTADLTVTPECACVCQNLSMWGLRWWWRGVSGLTKGHRDGGRNKLSSSEGI